MNYRDYYKRMEPRQIPSSTPISTELRVALHNSSSALDLGCGTGQKTLELQEYTRGRVLGIDINEAAIEQAKTLPGAARVTFVCLDASSMDTLKRVFDLISMSSLLTCIVPRSERQLVLRQAANCLTKNGILYIADFLQTWSHPAYRKRYLDGARETHDEGSFLVTETDEHILYCAHHFTEREIIEDVSVVGLRTVSFRTSECSSRTGNMIGSFVLLAAK